VDELVAWLRQQLDVDEWAWQMVAARDVVQLLNGEPLAPRMLAEVAAKRAILDHYEQWAATLRETPEGWTPETATAYRMAMEWNVRQHAQPFAGRPGWREEWAT
jgi:hypothetical protein